MVEPNGANSNLQNPIEALSEHQIIEIANELERWETQLRAMPPLPETAPDRFDGQDDRETITKHRVRSRNLKRSPS